MKLSRLGNAVPVLILRSPLHRLMSSRSLLLTFVGRKSGRTYTTPVAYLGDDDSVILTTDSRWWSNLLTTPRVDVHIRGQARQATARVVQDADEAIDGLAALVEAMPSYGRFAGVRRDEHGGADYGDARRAIEDGRVLIKLQLDDTATKGTDR